MSCSYMWGNSKIKHPPYVCAHLYTHVCSCACEGQRSTLGVFLVTLHLTLCSLVLALALVSRTIPFQMSPVEDASSLSTFCFWPQGPNPCALSTVSVNTSLRPISIISSATSLVQLWPGIVSVFLLQALTFFESHHCIDTGNQATIPKFNWYNVDCIQHSFLASVGTSHMYIYMHTDIDTHN